MSGYTSGKNPDVFKHGDNPILAAFRRAQEKGATAEDVRDDLIGYQTGYPGSDYIDGVYDALIWTEQWDTYSVHAIDVLDKLAGGPHE